MNTPRRVRLGRIGRPGTDLDRMPLAPAKGAVRGAVTGFVSVGIAVAVLAGIIGYETSQAALMGLFVGTWGGCGFGAMVGGTIAFLRTEDRARADAAATAVEDAAAGPNAAGRTQ